MSSWSFPEWWGKWLMIIDRFMNGPLNFINAILYKNLILIGMNWLILFEPFCLPIIHNIYIYIIISYDIPIITSLSPCFSNVFLQLLVFFLIMTVMRRSFSPKACGSADPQWPVSRCWVLQCPCCDDKTGCITVEIFTGSYGLNHAVVNYVTSVGYTPPKSNMELHAIPEVSQHEPLVR